MQLKIRVNDLNLKISETGSSFILLLSAWLILSLSAMILSCPEFLFAYTENVYTDYTEVSGDITGQNIEWTKAKSPYVVSGDIYVYGGTDVSNVATLTIEKGVVVRFKSGTTLYAGSASSTRHWGAIFAQGTASEPIIFTSNESVPSPGDWRGIYFRNDTDGNSTLLEHCIIEYGGYLTTSNIYCYSVSPTIRNCEIHKSSAHGIYLNNASPVITDNIIKNNVLDGIYGNDLSKPQINGNDFRDTDNDGIRQRYAVNIYPNGVSNMGDNIGSGIDGEYINIRAGNITSDITWNALSADALPYVVAGHIYVYGGTDVSNVATLTIEKGVVVRFKSGTTLYAGSASSTRHWGAIFAQGTASEPIIFTSNEAVPSPGDWKGIYFRNDTDGNSTLLEHCIIEYGGYLTTSNVYCYSVSPTIRNCEIHKSSVHGIYLNNASPVITDNIIKNNVLDGIYGNDLSKPQINGNDFRDTDNDGIRQRYAVNIYPNGVTTMGDNIGSGIDGEYINIRAGNITSDITWNALSADALPYVVAGNIYVYGGTDVSNVATLTIEKGVVVRFNSGTTLYAGSASSTRHWGAIVAQGTASEPIIFTSNEAVPSPGDWRGIYFRNGTDGNSTLLEHCIIEYGGYLTTSNIYCYSVSPTIRNCEIHKSCAHGIYVNNASPVIADNIIKNNVLDGIYGNDLSKPQINGNDFRDTDNDGIRQRYAVNIYPNGVSNMGDNIGSGIDGEYINIRAGNITSDITWNALSADALPYVVAGNIYVYGGTDVSNVATLTIEKGVVVRFNSGTTLYAGSASSTRHWGAIFAQGTASEPIFFTSNEAVPAPGDWRGIYFKSDTYADSTLLEHCIIEYGGNAYGANIYCNSAAPSIRYNTISNSSLSGIVINGSGCSNAVIECNNFKDNIRGISLINSAAPQITGNNFLRNHPYGLHNATASVNVIAVDNWWGDANGPGFNGDEVYGNVDYGERPDPEPDLWLTEESSCITSPPTNRSPFSPTNPSPANNAVRISVFDVDGFTPIPVDLSWAGGDPNPWDTVVYDVYLSDDPQNLEMVAQDLADKTFSIAPGELSEGTTYFWQVVARDNYETPEQTPGPIWQFTTLGDAPDLIITDITWDLADPVSAGDTLIFTATIQNNGSGPAVDSCKVDFLINGSSIGKETANPVIAAGGNVLVNHSWIARTGYLTIEAVVDSAGDIVESVEDNNNYSIALPTVFDTTAPELAGTTPSDGASLQSVSEIVIMLEDEHGELDHDAIRASILVTDSNGTVSGDVNVSGDQFIFVPSGISTLSSDTYSVSLTAQDMTGNIQVFAFAFTVDNQAPTMPAVSGASVYSGLIQGRPAQNQSNTTTVTIEGTRESSSSVWINGTLREPIGSGGWSISLSLSEGDNVLEIFLEDAALNRSESIWVDIFVDSAAPSITGVMPLNNSFLNAAPSSFVIGYQEDTSGLNFNNLDHTIKDNTMDDVSGNWTDSGGNQLTFTPTAPFDESEYTVNVMLEDNLGNQSAPVQYTFTVDSTPPDPPAINPVTSPAYNSIQLVTGTKETYARIVMGGTEVVGPTAEIDWQHTVNLMSGQNSFSFAAVDRAENQSAEAEVDIFYDDIPPLPLGLDILEADGERDGFSVELDWSDYDETVHGDIDFYRIYYSTTEFNDVASLTALSETVEAAEFTYIIQNLIKGTQYWFAVVPVDFMGHADTNVISVPAIPIDVTPPEDVTNINVVSNENSLDFSWTGSENTDGDLAGYNAYVDCVSETIPPGDSSISKPCDPATSLIFKITSFDGETPPNESIGVTLTAATLLDNPTGLSATPYDGYVTLNWSASSPSGLVDHYVVYYSTSDFTSVADMDPVQTTTALSATITGLANHSQYFFAVTVVNISNGERQEVLRTSAIPVPDQQGPSISNLQYEGAAFAEGQTISKSGTISLNASDIANVSRVEFKLDGTLIRTDFSSPYTCDLDAFFLADGTHTLIITAYDSLNNSTEEQLSFNIALNVPPALVITHPSDGYVTNLTDVTITGSAEKDSAITIYRDINGTNTPLNVTVNADSSGNFSATIALEEGANILSATASNRSGEGAFSSSVTITLDKTVPQSPTHLSASPKENGQVRLTWQKPLDLNITGYNIYRSSASFDNIANAVKLNTVLVTSTAYTDLPASDGTYYYRVTAVNVPGNESEPSEEAYVVSDSMAPVATTIAYTPQGNVDPGTGAMAPGRVDVIVTISEILMTTPFMSITPESGIPISVELNKNADTDTQYSGFFTITDSTPTGTAWAVFSARDMAGNRGTQIGQGESIIIDTSGPAITRIEISPDAPVKNDEQNPVSITATFGLNEEIKSGEAPDINWLLSGANRTEIAIASLTQLVAQSGDAQTWQGDIILPADAGLSDTETLSFVYNGSDDLDNISSVIECNNLFQIYQGDLPPLDFPPGLTGTSLPGGEIRLTWNEVADADGYQLSRQAPTETELTAYGNSIESSVLEFIDPPSTDGLYIYGIASIRQENGETAVSGTGETVTVHSDATAPPAPENLALDLASNGIHAVWQDVSGGYTEPITFSLYRFADEAITSISEMTLVAENIAYISSDHEALDPNPSSSDHYYAVAAVDEAGNISVPSAHAYLNFGLLPVADLTVVQVDDSMPIITWTHPDANGSIDGYDIYYGFGTTGNVKLNSNLISGTTYTDTGYSTDERVYAIVAVDNNGEESIARSIVFPFMDARLNESASVKRGIMNRLSYDVTNNSIDPVNNIQLKVRVDAYDHISEKFSLAAGETRPIDVVVGGYTDLPDIADLITTIEISPNAGESVQIIRSNEIEVGEGALSLQILNEEFIRNGSGSVRFVLENSCADEIEIITAENNGSKASGEIIWHLLDEDENIVYAQSFQQAFGTDVYTLSNGNTVARIPANGSFTSESMNLDVPANAPDNLTVLLSMSNIYYHHGQNDEVAMQGMSVRRDITLVETTYSGEITTVTPQTSTGDQDIIITGRAIERDTGAVLGNASIRLIVTVRGFEREFDIMTDANGEFTYHYTPQNGESGEYTVCAVHPELLDRPVQGEFVISRVSIQYTDINMNIPWNYEYGYSFEVTSGPGTDVTNLQVVYEASDQPDGVLPQGIHITSGEPVSLSATESTDLSFTVWGDNLANQTESFVLKVVSDENPGIGWGTILVNMHFSEANPALYFSPDHIETGMPLGDTISETIVLENKGVVAMQDVSLELVTPDGSAAVFMNSDGTPAPSSIYLTTPSDLGAIDIGETKQVSIVFAPPETAIEGNFPYYLRVTSANYHTVDINLFAAVTQSGIGNALFKVADIYTGTLDEYGDAIQGVNTAKVYIQNEAVLSEDFEIYTDNMGEAFFQDLPSGRYKYRVRADNHQEKIGRIWIKPGITISEEVFIDYNLVTVEWEVTETTIQDRYDIVLHATYETHVPAPVVIIEPTSVSLNYMKTGDVLNGEFTMTNYGLVRADDLKLSLPSDDANFKYEFLANIPESIDAMERVTVSYRITCLASFGQEDEEEATGGGCSSYSKCANASYSYKCANNNESSGSGSSCWTASSGSGCGGSGFFGSGRSSGGSSGSGGGGGGGYARIGGSKCTPAPGGCRGGCCFGGGGGGDGGGFPTCGGSPDRRDQCQNTGSSVSLVARMYYKEFTDLSVKVPGGIVEVKRLYTNDKWYRNHSAFMRYVSETPYVPIIALGTGSGSGGGSAGIGFPVTTTNPYEIIYHKDRINHNGVVFHQETGDENIYTYKTYRIIVTNRNSGGDPASCRWEANNGNWRSYDIVTISPWSARMTSWGDNNGTLANVLYDEAGEISGITDKYDNQVLWYEGASAVYDAVGRRVEYGTRTGQADEYGNLIYSDSVTDFLGNITTYQYRKVPHLQFDIEESTTPSLGTGSGSGGGGTGLVGPGVTLPPRIALTAISYHDGRKTSIHFGVYGEVDSVKDENGVGYSFEYDYDQSAREYYALIKTSSNMIKEVWFDEDGFTKQVDINGRTIQKISKSGRNYEIIDENGHVTTKNYDEWEMPTKIVYPDGSKITIAYDNTFHRPVKKTDEQGIVTEYAYDENGNLIRKVEAAGTVDERETLHTYDADGNVLTVTRGSSETSMVYDTTSNITSVTDPEGNVTSFIEYDVSGNVLSKTDPNGNIWTYTYDAAGNMTSATDPLDHTTTFEYDGWGNRTRSVAVNGLETLYEYDGHDNLIKQTVVADAADLTKNRVTQFAYNTDNKLTTQTDPAGNEIHYHYNNEGQLLNTTDGTGNVIAMAYDESGTGCASCSSGGGVSQPSKTIFPTFEKQYTYDKRGRKIAEKDVLNVENIYETGFVYDAAGNLIAKTDKEGRITFYEYDGLNRLIRVTDPLNGVTAYEYDSRDNLISLIDSEGNTTSFDYDANNRLIRETRPMGEETEYAYDGAGNLISKIDAKDQKAEYFYDDAGRLVTIFYYAYSADTTAQKTVTFTYDATGNLTGYNDGQTSATYAYDAVYQKTAETVDFGTFSKANAYSYYKNGLKQTFTGSDTIAYGYLYDSNNQLTGVQIPNLGFISVNEYEWTRPTSMTLPGGTTKTFDYDPLMRVTQILAKDPGANEIINYQYDYDKMDNIQAKNTEHGEYGYLYDELYRLETVDNPDITGLSDESFTYDGVGNRISSVDSLGEWGYNANNELLGVDDVSYDYDVNGNMVKKTNAGQVTSFVYNIEDRLVAVWEGEVGTGTLIAEYYYDPFGRRLWKEVEEVRTYFHYADEGLIGEYDSTGTEIKTYGYKPGSTWTTDPLFVKENGQYYFYHNDHLGTPQKITAVNGAVVWSAKYSSFGKATVEIETVENNLRFPGQYFDQETGLHYNMWRYYDADAGRYLRADPLNFTQVLLEKQIKLNEIALSSLNDSTQLKYRFKITVLYYYLMKVHQDLNFYLYTKNNPCNLVDARGLMSKKPKLPPLFLEPSDYEGDATDYCLKSYDGMVRHCSTDFCTAEVCLYRAGQWYTACMNWALNQ